MDDAHVGQLRALYGPWALVLGASEGVGAALAAELANAGIGVVLVSRRAESLQRIADRLDGAESRVLAVDLSRPDAAARVLAQIGDLEIGFAAFAAGADDHGCDFVDAELDDWVALVQRNVVTTTILSYHLGTSMKARGRGGLVYLSSGAGWNGSGRIAVYSATKAYDRNLGEGLWAELSPHGVHVLTIQLQATNTPAMQRLLDAHNLTIAGLDEPVDVARTILERLPQGPSYSMGEDDGRVPSELSAARRREQVIATTEGSAAFFGGP